MADITGLGSVADLINNGLDKIFPDKTQAAAAKAQFELAQQAGEFKLMEAEFEANKQQMIVNAAEAENASIFVSGWRPFIGWCCGAAFIYSAIIQPLMTFIVRTFGFMMVPPVIDTTLTMQVLLGMLGLGAMRSYDKKVGNNKG